MTVLARARGGFTLWETALVLAILGVTLALVAPALGNFGYYKTQSDAESLLTLLRDARRQAVQTSTTVAVRLDPTSGTFRVDTTGVNGMGPYATGTIDLGGATVFETELDRLTFLFQPSGASFSDSVAVRGPGGTLMVQVDPWTGVAYAGQR
ncbi:MAG: hypothetical protein O2973_07610 [Gemmatimonadetes bacterium]|nr:hypothetical protein [Gemmatimonadota bacterium]